MESIMAGIIIQLLLAYPAWKIYKKVGLNPTKSLTVLIPIGGILICTLILANSEWKIYSNGGK